MKDYKHILLAVDITDKSYLVPTGRALEIADNTGAKISLLYVVPEPQLYGHDYYPGFIHPNTRLEQAQQNLAEVGRQLGVPSHDQFVKSGVPHDLIIKQSDLINADLIVLGSHGHHGIRLLLGSTASAVLNEARCDVLAVRISEESANLKAQIPVVEHSAATN